MQKGSRDYEARETQARALATIECRHVDAGRGGAAKEGAEPNDVTQLTGGGPIV